MTSEVMNKAMSEKRSAKRVTMRDEECGVGAPNLTSVRLSSAWRTSSVAEAMGSVGIELRSLSYNCLAYSSSDIVGRGGGEGVDVEVAAGGGTGVEGVGAAGVRAGAGAGVGAGGAISVNSIMSPCETFSEDRDLPPSALPPAVLYSNTPSFIF